LCIADHVAGSEWWTFEGFAASANDVKFGRLVYRIGGQWNEAGQYREMTSEVVWTSPKWWSWIATRPLVVIDDIGIRGRASDAAYEAFKGLLDVRSGKPLIVTSNHDVAVMATIFDARVFDRIACGTVAEMVGDSRR
jgi:hypothetical protein